MHPRLPTVSCLLLLSLSACRPPEPGVPEEDATGTLRVTFENNVRAAFEERTFELRDEPPGLLVLCGEDDPEPRLADDEVTLCLRLQLDTAVLGTGPVTLPFEGSARMPAGLGLEAPAFTPAAGNDTRVRAAWAWTGCFSGPSEAATTQQVRGTLTLTENSATRLAGHLALTAEGELAGPCGGKSAEADLDFTVER